MAIAVVVVLAYTLDVGVVVGVVVGVAVAVVVGVVVGRPLLNPRFVLFHHKHWGCGS